MNGRHAVLAAVAASVLMAMEAGSACAQEGSWSREKCARYTRDWNGVLARYGKDAMSKEFLDSHNAFIHGGCSVRGAVCPRSAKDFEIANVLTIRAMNFGAASTFLPFGCAK